MGACRWDLEANGVDLDRANYAELRCLARKHLDYFQLMLGYDISAAEVLALLKRTLRR